MAQEFIIKSEQIEDKINQLLPSQGGFAAGVDFSASTMVIPIVDLTETAEGSALRADLQSAFSLNNTSKASVSGSSSTFISTTGYWRLQGNSFASFNGNNTAKIQITDGTTTTVVYELQAYNTAVTDIVAGIPFDFVIYVQAGESVAAVADTGARLNVQARQLADLSGNLTNP